MFKIITKGPTRRKTNSKHPLYSVCQDTKKRKIVGPNQVVFKCVRMVDDLMNFDKSSA